MSVLGKVFAHVLLGRLILLFTGCRMQQQSGFTTGRSTSDAILVFRLLAEIHAVFKLPLHVPYVDLKSAFDSVDRSALWKALQGIEPHKIILRLLRDLHALRHRRSCEDRERHV